MKQICADNCKGIEERFIDEEVFGCLRDCNGDKALGPNGFNMKFLQEFWEVLKADLMVVFDYFYRSGSFAKPINATIFCPYPKLRVQMILGIFGRTAL